jgi:hypothetical protein
MSPFLAVCYPANKGTTQRYRTQGQEVQWGQRVTRQVPFERYTAQGHNLIRIKKNPINSESCEGPFGCEFPAPRALTETWDYTEPGE